MREPCLGERRAAATVVDDLSHDALDVAVSLREVLRGACQRVRCSGTLRQQAGSQPPGCLLASSERHGTRRQPVKQGSRSGVAACRRCRALQAAVHGLRQRRPEPAQGDAAAAAGAARERTQRRTAQRVRVAHHAAQLGGALAVVRVRLEDAAAALPLRANYCETSRRASAASAALSRSSASNAPRPISALRRHAPTPLGGRGKEGRLTWQARRCQRPVRQSVRNEKKSCTCTAAGTRPWLPKAAGGARLSCMCRNSTTPFLRYLCEGVPPRSGTGR